MHALIIILGICIIGFGIMFTLTVDFPANLPECLKIIIGVSIIVIGIGVLAGGIALEESCCHTIYSSNEYDLDALYQEYVEKYGESGDKIICKIINDVEANSKETEYIDVRYKGEGCYRIEYHKFSPNHIADKYKKHIGE